MDQNQFNLLLLTLFKKNGLQEPAQEEAEKLYSLTNIMLDVNKSMNLTAITSHSGIILKHYVDSLTISAMIPEGSTLLDVGCGAGFPTLPLAIFRPDISITALDSTAKKIDYVKQTAKKLELYNVSTISARAEELAHNSDYRERFDIVTARAVAALPILSELCLPFVKKGGHFISMKGQKGEEEFNDAQHAIDVCGGEIASLNIIKLRSEKGDEDSRIIFEITKTSHTPVKYPRQYSRISKTPL